MNLSLNELESLAKRAARGGGYSWGMSEEAGKSVRWLCVQGIDGVGQLAALLQKSLTGLPANHRPEHSDLTRIWQSSDQLCPLATGAYLSDCAKKFMTGECEIHQVAQPALLIPFAANIALLNGVTITIACNETAATTDGSSVNMTQAFADKADVLHVRTGGSMSRQVIKQHRAIVDNGCLQVLTHFAELTYAPATRESRLLGAGAELSDNN